MSKAAVTVVAKPVLSLLPRRLGAIAVKTGMTSVWDKFGTRIPITLMHIKDNEVLKVHEMPSNARRDGMVGYRYGMQVVVGADNHTVSSRIDRSTAGEFLSLGTLAKKVMKSFKVSEECVLEPGTTLTTHHFVAGQYVDVTAISKGKGMSGVMKRWGYKGQTATHGTSKAHRLAGSTGQSTTPGKQWKGKKMAGRHGGDQITVHSLQVVRIDHEKGLLFLRGSVPGPRKGYVYLRDAIRKPYPETLPFPTDTNPSARSEIEEMDFGDKSPFELEA